MSESGQRSAAKSRLPRASLRPLGLPRPVVVLSDDAGLPTAVDLSRSRNGPRQRGRSEEPHLVSVVRVDEIWRVAEGWWRDEAVARTYYRLVLEDGRPVTLFHDDGGAAGGGWFSQHYR